MDAIYEYGKADPLDAAYVLAHYAHMNTHADVETLWEMLIDANAQILGKQPDECRVVEGNEGSVIVHGAPTPHDVLRTRAPRRLVVTNGTVVSNAAQTETQFPSPITSVQLTLCVTPARMANRLTLVRFQSHVFESQRIYILYLRCFGYTIQ